MLVPLAKHMLPLTPHILIDAWPHTCASMYGHTHVHGCVASHVCIDLGPTHVYWYLGLHPHWYASHVCVRMGIHIDIWLYRLQKPPGAHTLCLVLRLSLQPEHFAVCLLKSSQIE